MMLGIVILLLVTVQRLGELWLSNRNTHRLLAHGASEHAPQHYWWIVALHTAWLGTLWWLAPGRPVDLPLLALFGLVEIARIWVVQTLGRRWTTRIIVLPGESLVTRGPYKYLAHPNYAVVVAEIALLPLVFGLWRTAIVFSLLNAAALAIRIRAENRALSACRSRSGETPARPAR